MIHSGDVMKERLDKLISAQTGLSRRDAARAIRGRRVTVNGEECRSGDARIDTDRDSVTLDGAALSFSRNVYYMMNKPPGVVSATEDRTERTVIDILPAGLRRRGVFPAGRLDKDTTGLLLLTDDGDFAHRMLSPGKHVDKTYIALLDRDPEDDAGERFAGGIVLADGTRCLPAEAVRVGEGEYRVTLREGKYHQVKRMFAALGSHVVALRRISIGGLSLDESLGEGEVRELTEDERRMVFE